MKTTHSFYRISGYRWLQATLTGIILTASSYCYSQDYKTNDTVHVDEVVISSENLKRFQAGAKIEIISPTQFELEKDGNLEQILSHRTPIAIKNQGGSFSTIRVRGTSPNHTSINFGGINLNSLTLGHANISNFPIYLFDEIGIQYGSSSSVNGSGNIGGAIHLGLKNYWVNGLKFELRTAYGSFGEQSYGTKVHLGNGKFESVTRAYYYYKTNNFKFINPNVRDVENGIFEIKDTQKRSNIENFGVIQEINYRFAANETFKMMAWLANDWHNIQPNMQSNLSDAKLDPIENKHIRAWSEYNNKKHKVNYLLGAGYVCDDQITGNNKSDKIQTQRIIGEAKIEHKLSSTNSYQIGTKAYRILPTVHAYDLSLIYEDRIDFYASYQQQFFNRLKGTINLRKGFITGFKAPFTPSLGLSFIVISRENYIVNINGNVAKSYRVASFNDRYWDQENFKGNPNINPEDGMNYELGANWSYCSKSFTSEIKLNGFYMDIENWILWKPIGAIWTADNVERVISKGLELVWHNTNNWGQKKLSYGLNYSLTSTQRVETQDANKDALFRQLEYVPLHSGNVFTSIKFKNLSMGIDGTYKHWQYSNETKKSLIDEYVLVNASIKYDLQIKDKQVLTFSLLFNNILNKNYISTYDYAMPRFNYRFSISYKFN